MRLLLTSQGLTNKGIQNALLELVGKTAQETSLVFVPTASNIIPEDKSWLIEDLMFIESQKFKSVMIADISAISEEIWGPQFQEADVLYFEGGDTYHLRSWLARTGIDSKLQEYLKTKVYVGASAGSMVTGPDLNILLNKVIYGEEAEKKPMEGLGLVDFYFLPHLNSPHFDVRTEGALTEAMRGVTRKTYVLDDQSALKVVDGAVEYVGEGEHLVYNA